MGLTLIKMADSTYVALKDESSLSRFEITQCQEIRSGSKSSISLKILLGWLVLLLLLVCGLCIIVRPQTDMTQTNMDLKNNQTRRTLGTRFVPLEMHEMSRSHVVSHQVKTNHSQIRQNVSLSQKSSSDDKVRVKRQFELFGIHVLHPYYTHTTSRPTTVTPWVEAYNETHNIMQNYTFRHIVKATDERENLTSLDYSKDLHFWHTEKYSRCQTYKEILDECSRNNLTSQTSVKVTSPLEIVKTEKSLIKDMTDNLTVEKCDSIRGLMYLCHSENIFPEKHIDLSGI